MRTMKTVDVPATKKDLIARITCDFCAAEIKPDQKHHYDFDEVKIERSVGSRYPDCGNGVDTTIDCCPTCWTAKVLPALQALLVPGAAPHTEEWDW